MNSESSSNTENNIKFNLFEALKNNDTLVLESIFQQQPALFLTGWKSRAGNTFAITFACQFSSTDTVKLLVERFNADISKKGLYLRNCFLSACCSPDPEQRQTLAYLHSLDPELWKGKGFNSRGWPSI